MSKLSTRSKEVRFKERSVYICTISAKLIVTLSSFLHIVTLSSSLHISDGFSYGGDFRLSNRNSVNTMSCSFLRLGVSDSPGFLMMKIYQVEVCHGAVHIDRRSCCGLCSPLKHLSTVKHKWKLCIV
jgi:hypothetical protein